MDDNTKELLIQQKTEEINKLKEEIKALKGESLAALIKEKPIEAVVYTKYFDGRPDDWHTSSHFDVLDILKKLSLRIHFTDKEQGTYGGHWSDTHRCYVDRDAYECYCADRRPTQKKLKQEQRVLSARFIDQAVLLFNEYVKLANPCFEFFGELVDPWKDQ